MKFCYEASEEDGSFVEKQLICRVCGCDDFSKTSLKVKDKTVGTYTCDSCGDIFLFAKEIKEI